MVTVGAAVDVRACGRFHDLRNAEVEHFHDAIGRDLDVAGFKSRWMMPRSWAAASTSAICRAIATVSGTEMGPRAMRVGQRVTVDQLENQRLHPIGLFQSIDRADVWMIEGRQDTSLAFEPSQPIGVAGEEARQNLDGDVAA